MLKQRLLMAASNSAPTPPASGNLYGWGSNVNGGTAQNTATGNTLSPTAAVDSHTNWSMIMMSISRGGSGAVAGTGVIGLQNNGTLWSWGSNGAGGINGYIGQGNNNNVYLVPTRIGTDSDWAYIAMNNEGGLAIKNNGSLWSWGMDMYGDLGQGGGGASYYVPTQVGAGTNWAKVFGGYNTTFLIDTSGKLWAIGSNSLYTTGLGVNSGNTTTITQVGSATNWIYVSTINGGTIGLQSNGTLWSWGTDQAGELCQGISSAVPTPTQIGVLTTWSTAAMGGDGNSNNWAHFIKTDGTLWAAGSNFGYQTGRNTNSGNLTTPTQVGTDTNWSRVACFNSPAGGNGGSIGLKSNATLYSWGSNNAGQLGQGTSSGNVQIPTQIGSVTTWTLLGTSCSGSGQYCLGTHT